MKKIKQIILCLLVLMSTFAFAESDRILTQQEEQDVLSAIDNICGDTWCEGDFDFSFNKLECLKSTESCLFEWEFIDREYLDEDYETYKETRFPAQCVIKDIKEKDQIAKISYRNVLTYTDDLYDAVSDCIDQKEYDVYGKVWAKNVDKFLNQCAATASFEVKGGAIDTDDISLKSVRSKLIKVVSENSSYNDVGGLFLPGGYASLYLSSDFFVRTEECDKEAKEIFSTGDQTSAGLLIRNNQTNLEDVIIILREGSRWRENQSLEVQMTLYLSK